MNRVMFDRDIQNEQVLARYLDLYFYPRFNLHNFQRINDAQFAGIDVQFVSNNQIYIVDEKGYLSRSTIQDTFVLELISLNRNGQRVEGWFYKPEKQTIHYLMCWADRDPIDIYREQLTIDHLHRVETMLVNRRILQNYLEEQYGINRTYIQNNQDQLLRILQNGPINLPNSNSRYMVSYQKREQPLNIVTTKDEYIASGAVEARYMVYRDRIEDLL